MHDIFNISKLIIKKKLKILTDSEKSRLKQFNKDYPFLKDLNFESLVDKISEYTAINNDVAWEAILGKSNKEKLKAGIPFFKESWFKYVAAASIVLLFSVSYLVMNKDTQENRAVILEPVIEKGTDKATLTLEDGSTVILEKGSTYQAKNANSNGEQIIYQPTTDNRQLTTNTLTIPRGGQFFAMLSDGTKVWLNSESQLKYPVTFINGKTRQVELVYGEAYFEVSPSTEHKGSTFKVLTQAQEIEVLGTEFNIKAYKDEPNIYTTLVEGKVSLSTASMKQLLAPNQQSNFDLASKRVTIYTVDVYSEISWKNGLFSFKSMPLEDIMKVLSRWYDVEVVFADPNVEKVKFNGVLSKNQHLEEILTTIQNTNFINAYEIKNKKITIK
ncbi:MAG: FecR family protein [Bacteriovorax sp.]|nr:FecR family protein [Bacteriovorax sp.]